MFLKVVSAVNHGHSFCLFLPFLGGGGEGSFFFFYFVTF